MYIISTLLITIDLPLLHSYDINPFGLCFQSGFGSLQILASEVASIMADNLARMVTQRTFPNTEQINSAVQGRCRNKMQEARALVLYK